MNSNGNGLQLPGLVIELMLPYLIRPLGTFSPQPPSAPSPEEKEIGLFAFLEKGTGLFAFLGKGL